VTPTIRPAAVAAAAILRVTGRQGLDELSLAVQSVIGQTWLQLRYVPSSALRHVTVFLFIFPAF
jgi:hypothetical protein